MFSEFYFFFFVNVCRLNVVLLSVTSQELLGMAATEFITEALQRRVVFELRFRYGYLPTTRSLSEIAPPPSHLPDPLQPQKISNNFSLARCLCTLDCLQGFTPVVFIVDVSVLSRLLALGASVASGLL